MEDEVKRSRSTNPDDDEADVPSKKTALLKLKVLRIRVRTNIQGGPITPTTVADRNPD